MTMTKAQDDILIFSEDDINRTLKRLAHEIIETNKGTANLVLVGIVTRGKFLAERVAKLIEKIEGAPTPVGVIDVTLYRDDAEQTFKEVQQSQIPCDITGKDVILIDDVLNSGRTIRAALDALNDYGRPASVQLMVLLDRGHRELPISPDYVGKNVPTSKEQRVNVRLREVDDLEQVTVSSR